MSTQTIIYKGESPALVLQLVQCSAGYEIQAWHKGSTDVVMRQPIPKYEDAYCLYMEACERAAISPVMQVNPARTAGVIVGELRGMLAAYPMRTQDILRQFANDPAVIEKRAEIRSTASRTDLNDSLIRSLCTQLDREVAVREKLAEQQLYANNDTYGAF